jgi:DNA-binding NarL/FixJ family response regulator
MGENLPVDKGIDRGRDAFDRQAWGRAYEHLSAAAREEPLEVTDLERLAAAAYLAGYGKESSDLWAEASRECAEIGEIARAARCAFWLAFALLNGGEVARGGGWIDRAQRLLDQRRLDCVEQGYLRYGAALRATFSGDIGDGLRAFHEAAGIGERFQDPELTALARIGEGRCRIYMGEVEAGVALLDEAMVAVEANEVSAIATGDAYCTVIDGCVELFDVARAREWTAALSRWCDAQPELLLYRGQCLVHRAEIHLLRGDWDEALEELERARARMVEPAFPGILGAAAYLRAEVHRLRGEFAAAEDTYREAGALGRQPQPGLALLRLAQRQTDVATAAIRRAEQEADDPLTRARLLGPYVEIVIAAGDVDAAQMAASALEAIAAELRKPYLEAVAAHATGMTLLAAGDPSGALVALRRAWRGWHQLEAPHDAARARVQIASACRALGDTDSADMELDAARSAFETLGAVPDAAAVAALAPGAAQRPGGLTARELEVLALVARGSTNRQIAEHLVISEKTVASHVGHIFTKLGLSSRSAATAYAYEHDLT